MGWATVSGRSSARSRTSSTSAIAAGALYEEVPDLGQLAAYDASRTVNNLPVVGEVVSHENRLHILHRGVIVTVQVDAFAKQPEKNKAATFALGRAVVAAP